MFPTLVQWSALSILLPVGAAAWRYRALDRGLRQLAWFFFISGLFEVSLKLASSWGVANNLPVFHGFAAVNLLFLCAFYHSALRGRWPRRGVRLAAGLGLGFTAYYALLPGRIWLFPSAAITAQSVLFIGLALLYFYQFLQQQPVLPLKKQPLFWLNAGVLLYFSANLFVFLLQNWLTHLPATEAVAVWSIHSVVNILANSLYAVGLLCKPPPPP